jgi:uncharacterized RDD family membrane protein YckC
LGVVAKLHIFDQPTNLRPAPMLVSVLTSQNVVVEYEPASLGDRILAALVDYLVIFGWFLLMALVLQGFIKSDNAFGGVTGLILFGLPILLYDLLFEWLLNGQSPGKLAMSIRVVMQDGTRPGLGACAMRWLLRIVESVWFLGGIVPVLTIAINGRGQRVGDLAAGTTVIKIKPDIDLNALLINPEAENYTVQYPEARLLSDRDAGILRQVVAGLNDEVRTRAIERVRAVTGIVPQRAEQPFWTPAQQEQHFLTTLLRDHHFLTTQSR